MNQESGTSSAETHSEVRKVEEKAYGSHREHEIRVLYQEKVFLKENGESVMIDVLDPEDFPVDY